MFTVLHYPWAQTVVSFPSLQLISKSEVSFKLSVLHCLHQCLQVVCLFISLCVLPGGEVKNCHACANSCKNFGFWAERGKGCLGVWDITDKIGVKRFKSVSSGQKWDKSCGKVVLQIKTVAQCMIHSWAAVSREWIIESPPHVELCICQDWTYHSSVLK